MALRIAATWHVFNDVIDEPYHIGSGLAMLQGHRHVYGIQHPPLPRVVAAVPLYLAGVRCTDPKLGTIVDDLRGFDIGHEVLLRGRYSYWQTLIMARAPMLIFPLICVLYLYRLGKYLCNQLVGCVAAVMFSTDPTLLGHGAWVATDVACCAGYLAATFHGLRLIARPTFGRAVPAGLATGLALACKFSSAIALPALGLIWLLRRRRALATLPRIVPLGALSVLIAFLTLWTTYAFDFGRVDQLRMLDGGAPSRLPDWMRRTPLPMPTAVAGLSILAQHSERGHRAYLNGRLSDTGWWWYFPEAVLIKSPIEVLAGLALAIAMAARSRHWRGIRVAAIVVPGALFMLFAMSSRINIGIRHVLPAIPFLYLFIAMWLARGRAVILALVLIVAAIAETAMVHPDYIAYFNILVGGPANGEKYLLDSNLDWGQDLWRLRTWLEQNAKGRVISLRTFGNPRLREWSDDGDRIAAEGSPPQGLFAVSKNYAYDVYLDLLEDEQGNPYLSPAVTWVRQRKPIAQVGKSIEIYDLDAPR